MTKYEMAKRLGVSHQAVYKWTSGKSLPSQINLVALAKLLNRTPEAILKEFLRKKRKVNGTDASQRDL